MESVKLETFDGDEQREVSAEALDGREITMCTQALFGWAGDQRVLIALDPAGRSAYVCCLSIKFVERMYQQMLQDQVASYKKDAHAV